MEAGFETPNRAQFKRHEIKKERAVSLSGQTNQFSSGLGGRRIINVLKIGSLAAESRTVINDLAINLPRCIVDECHGSWLIRLAGEHHLGLGKEAVNFFVGDFVKRKVFTVDWKLRFSFNFSKSEGQLMRDLLGTKLDQTQA